MPSIRQLLLCLLTLAVLLCLNGVDSIHYEPTWESLDSRPLPGWYDKAKVGIFLHWGVFSVPSFDGAFFWERWRSEKNPSVVDFMKNNFRPGFTYADFASQFTAEFFKPNDWARLFQRSGAKYVVLTSKHHEGFTLWPSKRNMGWNSMDVGPRRDLVGDLAKAIRNSSDLHFGLYHSLYEWFNPIYLNDRKTNRSDFVQMKTLPELFELVENYKPDVVWSDGDWDMSEEYWQSKQFLAWLYNESPVKDTVVTNDRWGRGVPCKHGGFYTCADRFDPGVLQLHKWENCFTVDRRFWAFRRDLTVADVLSIEEILTKIARTISCGGNVLINVGPTHDGRIVPIFEERLTQMGDWLNVNGEAVYETQPWKHQNDSHNPSVWYTAKDRHAFAIVLQWPEDESLWLGSVSELSNCQLLGYGPVECSGNQVHFPSMAKVKTKWAWVVEFESDESFHGDGALDTNLVE